MPKTSTAGKAMTNFQQDAEQIELQRFVAAVDGVTVSEVLRRAVRDHLLARVTDPEFQTAARAYAARITERVAER
jgi:hypothetical protein